MSNITSTKAKPQAPQAAPDANAIASLIRGILGIALILPGLITGSAPWILIGILGITALICSVLAVILGSASLGDAYKRGERASVVATAGSNLGWIGVWFPVALCAFLAIFGGKPWTGVAAFVYLGIAAFLMYYTRRNYRR